MKKIILAGLVFFMASPSMAENYLLNGGQESRIKYQMVQQIYPSSNIRKLVLNYVHPGSFNSPTYNQEITGLNFSFSPPPGKRSEVTDKRGNKVIEAVWEAPFQPITATTSLTAQNRVKLKPLQTQALFPLSKLSEDVQIYLKATRQANSDNVQIQEKAKALTSSAKTEFDAVQKILTWVVDHMHYVLTPQRYDATYSYESGKGNCQNYSHLSAALMRAVGIPVRIVNGLTLKEPYDITLGESVLTMKLAQGRHSWIEVYFPDLGWVPFDPQGTELFVSNRFIRVEVGLDNNETEQDGLMRWTKAKGSKGRPQLAESIDAGFTVDNVSLTGQKMDYGPRSMLLCPRVEASFAKVAVEPPSAPPLKVSDDELKKLSFSAPYVFGNLEFPENVDFLTARGPAQETEDGEMKMRKNFLVETAEYVTTRGRQYAQTFILKKPIRLNKVALALHKFSDDGQLWLELFRDNNGMPGDLAATSDFLSLDKLKYSSGYSWVDFDFGSFELMLSPGRYWVALGFTGSPIVNWFFTYGKPVGPQDGTRYKKMFDETWGRSLSFEFNYKVEGLAVK
jgi:transglutaminase-like putative cysteine protease